MYLMFVVVKGVVEVEIDVEFELVTKAEEGEVKAVTQTADQAEKKGTEEELVDICHEIYF